MSDKIILPAEVVAEARDNSRRQWLRHAGLVTGLALAGGLAKNAFAQDTMMKDDAMADPAIADPNMSAVTENNPNSPGETIASAAMNPAASDVDILNFALGLEFLEADFYARVVEANQKRNYLPPMVAMAATKLAADEQAHVDAILELLQKAGATPVAKPGFQFPANVFLSPIAFLDLAATFEVTGTGAYLGAAPMVKGKDALRFAASIYGIEARHTGLIRHLGGMVFSPAAMETPLDMETVLNRVKPFIIG